MKTKVWKAFVVVAGLGLLIPLLTGYALSASPAPKREEF